MSDETAAVSKIETRAKSACAEALQVAITSHEQAVDAAEFLNRVINPLIKEGDELFDPMIASAHATHKLAIATKKKAVGNLPAAALFLRQRLGNWQAQVEEAERVEHMRLEAEAREADASRIERELEAIEASGSGPEDAAAQVQAVLESPRALAVEPPPPAPKIAGISTRNVYKAVVVNLREFYAGIADGRIPTTMATPDQGALNKVAGAMQDGFNWPGCRVEVSKQVNSRG